MTACRVALITISPPGLPSFSLVALPSAPAAPPLGIPLRRPTITIAPPGAPAVGLAVPVVAPPSAPPLGIPLRPAVVAVVTPALPSFSVVSLPDQPFQFCPLD